MKTKTLEDCAIEEKLAVVIETATFNKIEISLYCREKGLDPEQVKLRCNIS
jgi:hypothetical protein